MSRTERVLTFAVLAGVLRFAGWVVTTGSASGNNGKAARSYMADLALLERP